MSNNQLQQTVKKILERYLVDGKLHKTPERFTILREIYQLEDHFDVD